MSILMLGDEKLRYPILDQREKPGSQRQRCSYYISSLLNSKSLPSLWQRQRRLRVSLCSFFSSFHGQGGSVSLFCVLLGPSLIVSFGYIGALGWIAGDKWVGL